MQGLQGACLQPDHRAVHCMGTASTLLHLAECAPKGLAWLHHARLLHSLTYNRHVQQQPYESRPGLQLNCPSKVVHCGAQLICTLGLLRGMSCVGGCWCAKLAYVGSLQAQRRKQRVLACRALNSCAFEDVKVVIVGQDPYHNDGQVNC